MILSLSEELLDNDYIVFDYANNKRFVLNSVDEEFVIDGSPFAVKSCNLFVEVTEDNLTTIHKCTNIIGLGDDYVRVFSNNPELESLQVSVDNINEVFVELYE